MKIKIKKFAKLPEGFSDDAKDYRKELLALRGKWVKVETDFLFVSQYNTKKLRIMGENVEEIDYEGDVHLRAIHRLMQDGKINCHSYNGATGEFVDLRNR